MNTPRSAPRGLVAVGACVVSAVVFAACGAGSSGAGTGAGRPDASQDATFVFDTGSPDDGGNGLADVGSENASINPPPPALGVQIDRMGRPAINTALTHPFDLPVNAAAQGAAKDAYNAESSPTAWSTNVAPFAGVLAVYDGLDSRCGNQTGFDTPAGTGYTALATLLASDELWLKTDATTCQQYLGVELAALGALTAVDCGGRTLAENVMDLTYNLLAGTMTAATLPTQPGPVTNGVTAPASLPGTAFPYLATPH